MKIEHQPGFYVAGLTARTNNAHEMSGKGKIGNVWQDFLRPNLVVKIPNKIGVDLIAVYTDYDPGAIEDDLAQHLLQELLTTLCFMSR